MYFSAPRSNNDFIASLLPSNRVKNSEILLAIDEVIQMLRHLVSYDGNGPFLCRVVVRVHDSFSCIVFFSFFRRSLSFLSNFMLLYVVVRCVDIYYFARWSGGEVL